MWSPFSEGEFKMIRALLVSASMLTCVLPAFGKAHASDSELKNVKGFDCPCLVKGAACSTDTSQTCPVLAARDPNTGEACNPAGGACTSVSNMNTNYSCGSTTKNGYRCKTFTDSPCYLLKNGTCTDHETPIPGTDHKQYRCSCDSPAGPQGQGTFTNYDPLKSDLCPRS